MLASIERELTAFAKKEFGQDGLTFEFEENLGGAFSNKSGRLKLPKYVTASVDDGKLDVLKCLVAHEVCHLKYSDFDYQFDDSNPSLLLPALIIEDIAVERNLLEQYANAGPYLNRLNKSYVYEYFIRNKNYASMNVDDLTMRALFTNLSRTGHCPPNVIADAVQGDKMRSAFKKFQSLQKAIPEAFNDAIRPRTTKDSEDLARKVLAFFGDFEKPSYYFGS